MVGDIANPTRRPTVKKTTIPAYLSYTNAKHTYLPVKNLVMSSFSPLNGVSIAFWFRTKPVADNQTLLDCGMAMWFRLGVQENGRLMWNTSPATGRQDVMFSKKNYKYDDNEWHFIVATYEVLNNTTYRKELYNNGQLVQTKTVVTPQPGLQSTKSRFCIVGGNSSPTATYGVPAAFTNSFNGHVSMMRMWTTALSADHIQQYHLGTCGLYGTC
jgi:hypothetical protein